MVWKVLFIIFVIFLSLINVFGYNINHSEISGLQQSLAILLQVCIAFILGILYSLGWKQKLFSLKSTNIFLSIFIISMLLCIVDSVFQVYPIIYIQVQNSITAIVISLIAAAIVISIVNLFLIPFYIGLYKYKHNIESLMLVDKPYWKMLILYIIPALAGSIIFALSKYEHFAQYNFIDFCAIAFSVYEIIFLIGFAWNIRIFNRLFWKVTAIPYALMTFITPFFISDTFNQDFHFKQIILSNPVSLIYTITLTILFIFVVYKYAYK